MEEGMAINPKAMARAKRAASQRGRARPSHHAKQMARSGAKQPLPPAAPENMRSGGVKEEEAEEEASHSRSAFGNRDERLLPQGSADSEAGDGGRKSKGWNYSELLAQRAFPLYSDMPGLNDLSSFSLAKGLDSLGWNFEDLYGIHSSDPKVDTASYLTVDLKALSENLSQLSIAQRLFLDEEFLEMGMISQGLTLNSLDKKITPSEAMNEVESDDRVFGSSNEASELLNMSSDEGNTYAREQLSAIPIVPISGAETVSSANSEQTPLSLPSSHEMNSSTENRSAQICNQSNEKLPSNSFNLKDVEAELDALLDMAATDNSPGLFDGKKNSVLSSLSRDEVTSLSRSFSTPFKLDSNKSNTEASTSANFPPKPVIHFQQVQIPSSSQSISSTFKQDSYRGNAKPLDDAVPPLSRVPPSITSLLTSSAPKTYEGSSGSALLGSSEEDFDAWLDSI